jgi:hypothetical protein
MEASMSSLDERPSAEPSLTVLEAFLVMSDYIWRYSQRAGDDLITLLGDTELEADGQPTDPAALEDWIASVERIKAGQPPRGDS